MDQEPEILSVTLSEAANGLEELFAQVEETGLPVEICNKGKKVYLVCEEDYEDLEVINDEELLAEFEELAALTLHGLGEGGFDDQNIKEELEGVIFSSEDSADDSKSKVIAIEDIDDN